MSTKHAQAKLERKGERGSVLATAVLGMLSLILAVGMGVDISHFYLAKAELQNAVDAAALAGASALNSSAAGITEAATRATNVMNNYEFNKTGVTIPRANVLFATSLDGPYMDETAAGGVAANIRYVQVTTPPSPVGISFASIVLGDKRNLSATATAGMAPINTFMDWIPLSVIDYDVPMSPGNVYTIRSGPQNSVSPGNYQILAAAGPGGSDARIGLASGVHIPAGPDDVYEVDTKPGVSSGAVRGGVNTRFDDYAAGLDPSLYPPDTNIKENITYQEYRDGTSVQEPMHPGVPGRRVVIIPIVKQGEYDQGRNTVRFDRFGLFFLRTKASGGNGGDIVAEYISDTIVVGSGGYDPSGGPVSPSMTIPVLFK
ncbi:MAG TPA: pilus assembly protein TadG-related protein [Pyrinomonadaceae bacterium]|nr:pilus assembly protein TadG-related protein [Pyrinomonadaceae bacterium]